MPDNEVVLPEITGMSGMFDDKRRGGAGSTDERAIRQEQIKNERDNK